MVDPGPIIKSSFKLLKEELESIDILNKPEHIFNADESGIDLNARSGKVIVPKSSKRAYSEQKAPRDHITFMVRCSASGQVIATNNHIQKKLTIRALF